MPPNALVAARIICSICDLIVTSTVTGTARSPMPAATSAARVACTSATMTLAPSSANASAMPRPKPDPNRKVEVPKDLAARLAKNAKARATFEAFPYSKKNDYVTWIDGAKREETRAKRLDTTILQLAEGKSLMWKYEEKNK